LKAAIEAIAEQDWRPLRKLSDQGLTVGRKEWAEVEFVPTQSSRKRDLKPDRYLAIRIRPAQGELFPEGQPYHYFAVVTNMWSWDGEKLLRWQRERCGTVEKVHDVLKNDLAGLRSFRVGRLRIIYRVERNVVEIVAIGPRERIYEETFFILKKEGP
jgi:hypothetical protein